MLPSSCHCNLKQGCFIASEKTPGILLHTYIYLLHDVHTDFHCEEKLCDSKRLCLSWNKGLFRIKIKLQHLGREKESYQKSTSATVRNWTESVHDFCCIPFSSFHFLSSVCSLPVPHLCPLKSVGFQIDSWPSVIILLFSCTLPRMFIYIHVFNSIVNDLTGVNHSQDNGCKKLIDMIFMI